VSRPEQSLRAKAIRLLARRDHSRTELERKLRSTGADNEALKALLDDLGGHGLLCDERFAEQFASARRGKFGSLKIAHELRGKGVSDQIVEATLITLQGNELAAARAVWRKRFGVLPADFKDRAKQTRFLQGRGFSEEIIRRVLSSDDER
jgi:regulatory protein